MRDEDTTEAVPTAAGEVLGNQADDSFRKVQGQTDCTRLDAMHEAAISF
jgi:hypothetical protein